MSNTKHYLITAITLGLIGAASAALIGVTNLITKDKIVQNEIDKVNAGIKDIFGTDASVKSESNLTDAGFDNEYKYVNYLYTVSIDENNTGYAFRTTGSNMYGKISLLLGFEGTSYGFIGLYVVTNEQTYASTLEEKYLEPVNDGNRDIENVSCGATYGAKLVRDMINEAKEAIGELKE